MSRIIASFSADREVADLGETFTGDCPFFVREELGDLVFQNDGLDREVEPMEFPQPAETLAEVRLGKDALASTQGAGILNHLNHESGMVAESFAVLCGVHHDAVKPFFSV